jgi:histidyl-tRNA synthetase
MTAIRAVKGTRDLLPEEIGVWHRMEAAAHALFARYGYREIRTPIFEETQLFARGIGADTDVVSKEMYTFEDRDEQKTSLTLRPEATAGIVRSVIENNLTNTDPFLKVYAMGPMFRRERPQKGRYRQFHQVDVEAFGLSAPSVDVEIIEMAVALLRACGVAEYELILNSVGDAACRPAYVETLRAALRANAAALGPDSQRRTETNPLRVLDSKAPEEQELIASLPKIADSLCEPCREHFAEVRRELDLLGIAYRVDHRLVRGLDYYVKTTFEVTSGALGAQNSLLGGGRYDGLMKALGGPDVAGIGFAVGMERLALAMRAGVEETRCDVLVATPGRGASTEWLDRALLLQGSLRRGGLSVLLDHAPRSFKATMKLADKLHARYVALLGEDELARHVWTIRDMNASTQEAVEDGLVTTYVTAKRGKEKQNG